MNEQILEVLGEFYGLYPQAKAIKPESVKLFAILLGDIPAPRIRRAMMRLAQTSKYWPTVAEIREAAAAVETDEERAADEAKIKAKHDRFKEHQLKALGVDADGI